MPINILCCVSIDTRPLSQNLEVYMMGAQRSGDSLCHASRRLSCWWGCCAVDGGGFRYNSASDVPMFVLGFGERVCCRVWHTVDWQINSEMMQRVRWRYFCANDGYLIELIAHPVCLGMIYVRYRVKYD